MSKTGTGPVGGTQHRAAGNAGRLSDGPVRDAAGGLPVVDTGATRRSAVTEAEDATVRARLEAQRAHDEAAEARRVADEEGAKRGLLSFLDGFIAGQQGDAPHVLQARLKLHELKDRIHMGLLGTTAEDGTELNERWFRERAQAQVQAAFESALRTGQDEAGMPRHTLPAMSGTGQRRGQRFSAERLLGGLMQAMHRDKIHIRSIDQLTGSEEAEWIKEQAGKELNRKLLAMARPANKPNSLSIPIPVHALTEMVYGAEGESVEDRAQRLAENYALQDDVAEPRFMRPLLVDYKRPIDQRSFLGVTMATTDNNWTIPSVTDSHQAAWYAENADITDDALVIGNHTTRPYRVGARDQFSWMLTVSQGGFGIENLAIDEMLRASVQAEEHATYFGSGANNQPRGVWFWPGLGSETRAQADNTYAGWLSSIDTIDEKNIRTGGLGVVTTKPMRTVFRSLLDFPGTTGAAPMWRSLAGVMQQGGRIGGMLEEEMNTGRGIFLDEYRAVATTQASKAVATSGALTGGQLHAFIIKLWSDVIALAYSMGILTIDDISQAISGQTRATLNKYCDVVDRYPDSGKRVLATTAVPAG